MIVLIIYNFFMAILPQYQLQFYPIIYFIPGLHSGIQRIFRRFIFALIGSISPGPVNIIATGTGANFGFRRLR
jgi:hypothetical protein